jgi:hypothetical protein
MSDSNILFTADQLDTYTSYMRYRNERTINESVEDWFQWFRKRGKRYLKDAALKGHYEVLLDLPFEITTYMNKSLFQDIIERVKEMVPGCNVFIIEESREDCFDTFFYTLEISWR